MSAARLNEYSSVVYVETDAFPKTASAALCTMYMKRYVAGASRPPCTGAVAYLAILLGRGIYQLITLVTKFAYF